MSIFPRIAEAFSVDTPSLGKDFSKFPKPEDMSPEEREFHKIICRSMFEDEKPLIDRIREGLPSLPPPSSMPPSEKEGILSNLRRKFSGGKERF